LSVNSAFASKNRRVQARNSTVRMTAANELIFWQGLPRLVFEGSIWPPRKGSQSEWRRTPTISNGARGHAMQGVVEHAHEYFSKEESVESSTYRELLGVFECLQAMIGSCEGKFVVFEVDAKNLLGIVNRASPRLESRSTKVLLEDIIFLGRV